ncbi:MAG: ComEC/Rec2 family competence protein [Treponema sp.]|jgi:competence protein ComEC|nr:ComEC/Rec2 family competence protein [Treponema sp.]
MVGSEKTTPPVFAALGAAASYYAYPLLFSSGGFPLLGVLLVLIVLLSFGGVLSVSPFAFQGEPSGGRRSMPSFPGVSLLLLASAALGFSLGLAARKQVPGPPTAGLPRERITALTGRLAEDPRAYNDSRGIGSMDLSAVAGYGGVRASAKGRVSVFFPAEALSSLKEFGRGCEIYTEGTMAGWKGGMLFRASSVHVLKPASPLEQVRTNFRLALVKKFDGPVWGPLASALLLGIREDLDTDLSEGFRNSGCSHVLALSGMHLALLTGLIAFFLRRLLGIRAASAAGGIFVLGYVFLAGAQPSLVRSAIMYFLGLFSLLMFFKNRLLSTLSLSFIIQIIFQSEAGLSLSFILSYLALAGILWTGEDIRFLLRGKIPGLIGGSLSASLGAFAATAAACSFFFGILRPVGIIASLFIVPPASLFTVIALLALVVSFVLPPLFAPLDFVLTFLYRTLEFSVNLAGKVPGLDAPYPGPVLAASVLAALLVFGLKRLDLRYRKGFVPFG